MPTDMGSRFWRLANNPLAQGWVKKKPGQYKAKWLEANARHLGGSLEKVEEELAKQKEMDKAMNKEKRLQTEPFAGQPAKKKAKLEVLTIDEMRKKRVYNEIKAQGDSPIHH